jgi:hypothetical protein
LDLLLLLRLFALVLFPRNSRSEAGFLQSLYIIALENQKVNSFFNLFVKKTKNIDNTDKERSSFCVFLIFEAKIYAVGI